MINTRKNTKKASTTLWPELKQNLGWLSNFESQNLIMNHELQIEAAKFSTRT